MPHLTDRRVASATKTGTLSRLASQHHHLHHHSCETGVDGPRHPQTLIPETLHITFTAVAREQIHFIQDRLLAVARWADDSKIDEAATEFLIQPYRRLLDEMYQRDLPLARSADESDLLLHVRGSAAAVPTPRVSVMTRLLGGTRDQVTRLAKQLGGVTTVSGASRS
jgi:hypothetical protein